MKKALSLHTRYAVFPNPPCGGQISTSSAWLEGQRFSSGSGLGDTVAKLKPLTSKTAVWKEGKLPNGHLSATVIESWIKSLVFKLQTKFYIRIVQMNKTLSLHE